MSMIDQDIRVGVIGLGSMGLKHAKAYAALDGVRITALYDPDEVRADEAVVSTMALKVADLSGIENRVDAVSLATPSHVRAEVAVPLLENGVACLIEKPMALSEREAADIMAAADRGNSPVMVGHVERFNPAVEAFLSWLNISKASITGISAVREGPAPNRAIDANVIYDLMLHDIDLIRCFCPDASVAEISAEYEAGTGQDDAASAGLVLDNDVSISLMASRRATQKRRLLKVTTNLDTVEIDLLNRTVCIVGKRAKNIKVRPTQSLHAELLKFLDAVRGGSNPWPNGSEGLETLRWVSAISEAAGAG